MNYCARVSPAGGSRAHYSLVWAVRPRLLALFGELSATGEQHQHEPSGDFAGGCAMKRNCVGCLMVFALKRREELVASLVFTE